MQECLMLCDVRANCVSVLFGHDGLQFDTCTLYNKSQNTNKQFEDGDLEQNILTKIDCNSKYVFVQDAKSC